jgi:hypothetical protein
MTVDSAAIPGNMHRGFLILDWSKTIDNWRRLMNQIQAPARTSALAIWSLVLGILGLLCFSFLAAIPAVICGHLGRSKIRDSQGALQGNGLALAGLILGYLSLAFFVLGIIAAIAIPNFAAYMEQMQ